MLITVLVSFIRTELEVSLTTIPFCSILTKHFQRAVIDVLLMLHSRKIVILVSKESHCLGDILMKAFDGSLDVEISAVIGNHEKLQALTEKFDIPFHFVSHGSKPRRKRSSKSSKDTRLISLCSLNSCVF